MPQPEPVTVRPPRPRPDERLRSEPARSELFKKTKDAPETAGEEWLTGDTDGLDEDLRVKLQLLGEQLGKPIHSESGNRTYEEQKVLYQMYLNGTGNLAAPPGSSNHEGGDAVDAYVDGVALADVPGAAEKARKLGLGFPVAGEAWHVENVSGGDAPEQSNPIPEKAPGGLGFLPWAADQYGVNGRLVTEIARRESGFDPKRFKPRRQDPATGSNPQGMFQLDEATFNRYAPQAQQENPKAWKEVRQFDFTDWKQQALTAAWAVRHGKTEIFPSYETALKASGGEPRKQVDMEEALRPVEAERTSQANGGRSEQSRSDRPEQSRPDRPEQSRPDRPEQSRSDRAEQRRPEQRSSPERAPRPDNDKPERSPRESRETPRQSRPTPPAPSPVQQLPTEATPCPCPTDAAQYAVDPVTQVTTPPAGAPRSIDVATGYAVDAGTGFPIDPTYGVLIEPTTWTFATPEQVAAAQAAQTV